MKALEWGSHIDLFKRHLWGGVFKISQPLKEEGTP